MTDEKDKEKEKEKEKESESFRNEVKDVLTSLSEDLKKNGEKDSAAVVDKQIKKYKDEELLAQDLVMGKAKMKEAYNLAILMRDKKLIAMEALDRQVDEILKMSKSSLNSLKKAVEEATDKETYEKLKDKDDFRVECCSIIPILPKSKPKHVEEENKLSNYSNNAKSLINTLISYYRMKVKNRDAVVDALKDENKKLRERIAELNSSSVEYEDIIEDLIIDKNLFNEKQEEEPDVSSELEYLWPESAGYKNPIFKFGRFKVDRYDHGIESILEREREHKRKKDKAAVDGKGTGAFKRNN